jgi:hypothetical protein
MGFYGILVLGTVILAPHTLSATPRACGPHNSLCLEYPTRLEYHPCLSRQSLTVGPLPAPASALRLQGAGGRTGSCSPRRGTAGGGCKQEGAHVRWRGAQRRAHTCTLPSPPPPTLPTLPAHGWISQLERHATMRTHVHAPPPPTLPTYAPHHMRAHASRAHTTGVAHVPTHLRGDGQHRVQPVQQLLGRVLVPAGGGGVRFGVEAEARHGDSAGLLDLLGGEEVEVRGWEPVQDDEGGMGQWGRRCSGAAVMTGRRQGHSPAVELVGVVVEVEHLALREGGMAGWVGGWGGRAGGRPYFIWGTRLAMLRFARGQPRPTRQPRRPGRPATHALGLHAPGPCTRRCTCSSTEKAGEVSSR